jgi:formylglycine-generating enzyme required for sulfatase activity
VRTLACSVVVFVLAVGRGVVVADEPSAGPSPQQQAAPQEQAAVEQQAAPEPKVSPEQKAAAERLGLPVVITNSIAMKLVLIPAGEFMMGSAESVEEIARSFKMKSTTLLRDEYPRHRVRLSQPYYLSVQELTRLQYEQLFPWHPIMGPRHSEGPSCPVVMVGWQRAVEFCNKLSALPEEKAAGRVYRLPTEAEWEHACRAGSTTRYAFGDDADNLKDYACFDDNSDRGPNPVGRKPANAWGLFDMHGNVWEWCADRWAGDYYAQSPVDNPTGPASGTSRVIRGGSWTDPAEECLSSSRDRCRAATIFNDIGFRVALDAAAKGEPPKEAE